MAELWSDKWRCKIAEKSYNDVQYYRIKSEGPNHCHGDMLKNQNIC